jgi:hypothetical protein
LDSDKDPEMNLNTNILYSEQEHKFIRLMLDTGAQGNEVSTSCEMLVRSLRKRRVTSDAFLQNTVNYQLKQELLEQTLRANKMQAELKELQIQHTKQLEYLANLKSPAIVGRVHWTK